MKKIRTILFSLLALSTMSMVACNGGSNENTTPPTPGGGDDKEETETIYQLKYSVADLNELFDIATITVIYIDENSEEQQEVLTSASWSKMFDGIKAPFTASISLKAERNDTELTKDVYQVSKNFGLQYKLPSDSEWSGTIGRSTLPVKAEDMDFYIERLNNERPKQHIFE